MEFMTLEQLRERERGLYRGAEEKIVPLRLFCAINTEYLLRK